MADYVFGIHPVREVLRRDPGRVRAVLVERGSRNPRLRALAREAARHGLGPALEPRAVLDRLAGGGGHQGVVARLAPAAALTLAEMLALPAAGREPLYVVLDGVQDPGNLGAVIRTAAAAGARGVIVPARRSAALGPAAWKRSAGAAARLPVVRVPNLVRAMETLKEHGVWVVGADPRAAESYMEADFSGPLALVLGGEKGMRRLVREHCDRLVAVPMEQGVESLNLSVAAALLLYEAVRRRQKK